MSPHTVYFLIYARYGSPIGGEDLLRVMKMQKLTRDQLPKNTHMSNTTVTEACRGNPISLEKAQAIANDLHVDIHQIFRLTQEVKPLSSKTILEHHRFIDAVLDQAEKEMLIPYNAASKATSPKTHRKTPNHFQPKEI